MGKSVSEATSKGDSAKFVLKEGSENSTDSLIELLSESGTSEEEYSSTFLLLYSGCSSKVKANILPKFVFVPLLQQSCEGTG